MAFNFEPLLLLSRYVSRVTDDHHILSRKKPLRAKGQLKTRGEMNQNVKKEEIGTAEEEENGSESEQEKQAGGAQSGTETLREQLGLFILLKNPENSSVNRREICFIN